MDDTDLKLMEAKKTIIGVDHAELEGGMIAVVYLAEFTCKIQKVEDLLKVMIKQKNKCQPLYSDRIKSGIFLSWFPSEPSPHLESLPFA